MFKMKTSLIALAMVLFLSVTDNAQAKSKVTRVVCVGDSITVGARIKRKKQKTYPEQLAEILGDKYLVSNCGQSGATLLKKADRPYWKQSVYKKSHEFNADIVVIMLGTNDSKSKNWKHGGDFIVDYLAFIKTFKELKSRPEIFLVLPAPAFSGGFGINNKVIEGEIIPSIKKIAKKAKLKIIDINKPLKNKKKFFPDGIHPDKDGAAIIAKTIAKAILKK